MDILLFPSSSGLGWVRLYFHGRRLIWGTYLFSFFESALVYIVCLARRTWTNKFNVTVDRKKMQVIVVVEIAEDVSVDVDVDIGHGFSLWLKDKRGGASGKEEDNKIPN